METVILIIVLFIIILFLLFAVYKYWKTSQYLKDEFKDIIDRDSEIKERQERIDILIKKRKELEKEYDDRFTILNSDYLKNKSVYEDLRKEIELLEEKVDLQSYGIYKPHYDFTTSEEYKRNLELIIEQQKTLIKQEKAAICTTEWRVNNSVREGEKVTKQYIKLMLRAFNGECDSIMVKVRWNNVNVMEQRINKAFEAINKLGTVHSVFITEDYHKLKLSELYLTFEYEEKIYKEKEEQRRIQEQIREEEKVQKEIEQAKKQAEDEEKNYQKALEKAKGELEKAKGKEIDELNNKISLLEQQLQSAKELKERAISRAQVTKSGHVYIISNIGSFGENVFKIGMTRRLEPLDRVRELGDASVPFSFDVHSMIYSENAPELEGKLHEYFESKRINLINDRKEFFNVTIDDIETFAKQNKLKFTITKLAEAKEYRETLSLRLQLHPENIFREEQNNFPDTLITAQ